MSAQILVVSDDPHIKSQVQQKLQSEGYVVTLAPSISEALEKAAHEHLDLIVLDGTLAGRQSDWAGYDQEFMKQLRKVDTALRPRVLVLNMPWQNDGMFDWKTGPDAYGHRSDAIGSSRSLQQLIKRLLGAPPFGPDL